MTELKVSVIQTDLSFGAPQDNLDLILRKLDAAMRDEPDVILWPEMWNTCYDLTRLDSIADRAGKPSIQTLQAYAANHKVNLVAGSIADIREGRAYNTTYVINRCGECVDQYSKVHLIGLMEEDRYITPGAELGRFDIDGTPCGAIICYDLRFPELIRSLALDGAEVLFVPAQWPTVRLAHWRTLLVARAIENQMYVVSANRTGSDPKNDFPGHSMVIDPWGEIIHEAGTQDEIFTVVLKRGLVKEVRTRMPIFSDRAPQVYKLH